MSLSLGVLTFGVITIALEISVMWRRERGWGIQSTRIVGLTLIIIATMFLIASDLAEQRIALAMGLFGTVAGYLLGKTEKENS